MANIDDTLDALRAAKASSTKAVELLRRRMRDAEDAGDYVLYDRCAGVLELAFSAEKKAARRLIAGILDPGDGAAISLSDATAELDKRLKRLKQDAAALNEAATWLTTVTQIILTIAMV